MAKILLLLLLVLVGGSLQKVQELQVGPREECACADETNAVLLQVQTLRTECSNSIDELNQTLGNDIKATLEELRDSVDAIGNASREVAAKTGADLAKAKGERDELKATLAEMRSWMATMKTDSEAVAKFVSDYNNYPFQN